MHFYTKYIIFFSKGACNPKIYFAKFMVHFLLCSLSLFLICLFVCFLIYLALSVSVSWATLALKEVCISKCGALLLSKCGALLLYISFTLSAQLSKHK